MLSATAEEIIDRPIIPRSMIRFRHKFIPDKSKVEKLDIYIYIYNIAMH